MQGTVSAFLTLLVGYKTKRYLCSDYAESEKLDPIEADGVSSADEEVRIASALAKEVRKEKGGAAKAAKEAAAETAGNSAANPA